MGTIRMKRHSVVMAFALILACLLATLTPTGFAWADESDHVYIFCITDFHGHIETGAKLAGELDEVRAQHEADGTKRVVFASAGDNVGASVFASSIANDMPAMDQLKAMGLEVSAVGNHEFDKGVANLRDYTVPNLAPMRYVASNLVGSDLPNVPPYYIIQVNGKRVAFIGATTESVSKSVMEGNMGNLQTLPLVDSVNRYADQLRDGDESNGEADAVVALAHEANGMLVELNANVDAAVAGHSHTEAVAQTNAGAPIVQTGCYGASFGVVDLEWRDGRVAATATEEDVSEDVAENAQVKAIYEAAEVQAQELGKVVVGKIAPNDMGMPSTFNRGTADATLGTRMSEDNAENRGIESTAANLVAQATLASTKTRMGAEAADISVVNSGVLRSDLDKNGDGQVTFMEAHDLLPFGTTNAVVTITGAQLRQALEQQWQPAGNRRPVLWLGLSNNVTYSYVTSQEVVDESGATAPKGSVFDLRVNGKLVADADIFKVTGNAFILTGGDNFSAFAQGTDYIDTGYVDLDGLVDYLKEHAEEGIKSPLRRQSAGFQNLTIEGNTVSFDMSGLSYSTDEPDATYVHAVVNGVDFGYFPVTDTGAVADEPGLAQMPYAGQAHVQKTLTEEELATFGTQFRTTGYVAGDGVAIDDANATYVNFDAMPKEDTHGKTDPQPEPAPTPDPEPTPGPKPAPSPDPDPEPAPAPTPAPNNDSASEAAKQTATEQAVTEKKDAGTLASNQVTATQAEGSATPRQATTTPRTADDAGFPIAFALLFLTVCAPLVAHSWSRRC